MDEHVGSAQPERTARSPVAGSTPYRSDPPLGDSGPGQLEDVARLERRWPRRQGTAEGLDPQLVERRSGRPGSVDELAYPEGDGLQIRSAPVERRVEHQPAIGQDLAAGHFQIDADLEP